jgi:hypothetical protein
VSELCPEAIAGDALREEGLDVRAGILDSGALSGRVRGFGEGDLDNRRGRDARGERLPRGGVLSRLELSGERLLVEFGDRLRDGDRDLVARGTRLRLLSLSRVELRACDLSLDRLGDALSCRVGLPGDTRLDGSSRLGLLSGEIDRFRGRSETGL